MDETTVKTAKINAKDNFTKSKISITEKELNLMEVTDFGLNDFENIGISVVLYVNTKKVCAKELYLSPYQICPQHLHPNQGSSEGKEETFRCRSGIVFLYVEGENTENISAKIPDKYKDKFTVFNEIIMKPGQQYTLKPSMIHWFQGGPEGAILSEFSTHSDDASDIFHDENINRIAVDHLINNQ